MKRSALLALLFVATGACGQGAPKYQLLPLSVAVSRINLEDPLVNSIPKVYGINWTAEVFDGNTGALFTCIAVTRTDDSVFAMNCLPELTAADSPSLRGSSYSPFWLHQSIDGTLGWPVPASKWFVNQQTGVVTLCKMGAPGRKACVSTTPHA